MAKNKKVEESMFIKHYRLMVIPLVLVLYLFSHFLLNPYDPEWYYVEGESEIFESILFLIAYCAIITEISLWVSRVLNKWIPWDKSAALRAIVQVLALIGLIFIVYFGINLAFLVWLPIDRSSGLALEDKIDLWQSLIISINTAIFISAVHTGYFLIKNWRDSMMKAAELQLKAEKLERIASQAELESLRMQLDPHFLFNNFSTLSELVVEDQQIALKFIDNLSLVYRYMLSNIRKNVVSLKEELNFVESYYYLIHERMGAKVQLHINIDKELSQQFYVAPISLQLLVENAVKHNRASKECPLVIDIYIDGNFVIVENNIQPLVVSIPSSKVGLSNIDDRYRLLSEAKVIVEQTEQYFKVKLPLLLNRQMK